MFETCFQLTQKKKRGWAGWSEREKEKKWKIKVAKLTDEYNNMVIACESEVKVLLSRVQLCVTPRTVAHQAPLSMGFSRQETGVGCHALLQGIFLTQGSHLCLLGLLQWQTGSLPGHHLGNPKYQSKGANSITLPPCRVWWAECLPPPPRYPHHNS